VVGLSWLNWPVYQFSVKNQAYWWDGHTSIKTQEEHFEIAWYREWPQVHIINKDDWGHHRLDEDQTWEKDQQTSKVLVVLIS
jgi:hypothetical protein